MKILKIKIKFCETCKSVKFMKYTKFNIQLQTCILNLQYI